jgi:hypothetical protein
MMKVKLIQKTQAYEQAYFARITPCPSIELIFPEICKSYEVITVV